MQDADCSGRLSEFLKGPAEDDARKAAAVEGWILGVR